ncbi:MAG: zf-TFIIB domain-containing protein [Lachnospiraceae bacterium]|nr:zf-TFIIB domain-containing protein [Lachnospiraceae bacterium]
MNKFRNWLQRVMYGRYGQDSFGMFLMVLALILFTVSLFTIPYVYIAAFAIIGYEYFRMFSKNRAARYKENMWFIRNTAWARNLGAKIKYTFTEGRKYKVFKCPKCGQKLRVPRGRGKIEIRCRKCGEQFIRKS